MLVAQSRTAVMPFLLGGKAVASNSSLYEETHTLANLVDQV